MADWRKSIPNWLTALRLVLIPIFVVVLSEPTRATLNIAAVIFTLAAITDYADGIIARRYSAVSDFGKLLDPLADKILVMAALVVLTSLHDEYGLPFVPAWMVVVVLAREFWITGLRALAAAAGTIVPAGSGGKVKSLLQMVSIILLLLHSYSVTFLGFNLTFQFIGLNILLLSIVFSYLSAVDYSISILGTPRVLSSGQAAAATQAIAEAAKEVSANVFGREPEVESNIEPKNED